MRYKKKTTFKPVNLFLQKTLYMSCVSMKEPGFVTSDTGNQLNVHLKKKIAQTRWKKKI